jgi:hypothetical protein
MRESFPLTVFAAAVAAAFSGAPSVAHADASSQIGPLLTFANSTSTLGEPKVARSSNGRFAVTWTTKDASGNELRMGQIYNADATTASPAFQINQAAAGNANSTAVAMDPDGDLIAAWYEPRGNSPTAYWGAIHAQRFSPAGVALGREIVVGSAKQDNGNFINDQVGPIVVAVDGDGDFAVAWNQAHTLLALQSYAPLKGWYSISSKTWVKTYNAKGRLIAGKQVDSSSSGIHSATYTGFNAEGLDDLAMNQNGDMVLIYRKETDLTGADTASTLAQHLDLKLSSVSPPMTLDGADVQYKGVGIDASGNFTLATTNLKDGVLTVGHYAADGTLQGTPNKHSFSTISDIVNNNGSVTINANGDYVVTWSVWAPNDVRHLQYFHSDGSTHGAELTFAPAYYDSFSIAADANFNLVSAWGQTQIVGQRVTAPQ